MPELPGVKKKKYEEMGISEDEARIISSDLDMARYFEEVVEKTEDPKRATSFITTILMKHLKEELIGINDQKVTADMMAELVNLVKDGDISNNVAKAEVFDEMYETGRRPAEIVEEKGLKQVSDTGAIEKAAQEVIDENPGPVEDVKGGKDKAIGFLSGMVMKKMKGQANPAVVNDVMRKLLGL